MKRLLFSVFSIFVLFCISICLSQPSVRAQETDKSVSVASPYKMVERFVNDNTCFLIYVNLGQFNLEELGTTIQDAFHASMVQNGFDETSIKRTDDQFAVTVDTLVNMGNVLISEFTDGIELPDVFFIGYYTEDSIEPIFVVPIAGKNKKEQQTLCDLLENLDIDFQQNEDYIVLSPLMVEAELDAFLNDPESGGNADFEKMVENSQDATFSVYINAFPLEELLENNNASIDDVFEIAQEKKIPLKSLWGLFRKSFRNAVLTMDLNTLTTNTTVTFADKKSAASVRKLLESIIDTGSVLWAETLFDQIMEENDNDEIVTFMKSANIAGVTREYLRGLIRASLLPKQEENQLIMETKGLSVSTWAISGTIVGLFLPAIQSSRAAARRMQCTNNLKMLMLGIHNYHDVNQSLPPAFTVDEDGKPLHSWRVLLLPYLGESVLFEQIRLDEPWDSEWNSQFHDQMPDVYRCPETLDLEEGKTHYSIIVGEGSVFDQTDGKNGTLAKIADGTSNTLAIVERVKSVCWMDPSQEFTMEDIENGFDASTDDYLTSDHSGGINAAMFDGSVRFIENTTSPEKLKAMATRNGSEIVRFD